MILPLTGIMVQVENPTGNGTGTKVDMPALALVMSEVRGDSETTSVNITAIVVITPEQELSLINHTPSLKFRPYAVVSGQKVPPAAPLVIPPDVLRRLP